MGKQCHDRLTRPGPSFRSFFLLFPSVKAHVTRDQLSMGLGLAAPDLMYALAWPARE
jgi:hypothetical protein